MSEPPLSWVAELSCKRGNSAPARFLALAFAWEWRQHWTMTVGGRLPAWHRKHLCVFHGAVWKIGPLDQFRLQLEMRGDDISGSVIPQAQD